MILKYKFRKYDHSADLNNPEELKREGMEPELSYCDKNNALKDSTWTTNQNHDEAIMAQEKEIEREIAESIPLVGPKSQLDLLLREYSNEDMIYQQKIQDLQKKYKFLRRTRPDGNCFFRAVSFAYLESLLNDPEEFKRLKSLVEKCKEDLITLGFSKFTIEDFHEMFMDVLEKIEAHIDLDELIGIFNDQGRSDYIVVYMRLLTSGHLQKEEPFFSSFIEGDKTMKEFCNQEVEPMYRESDHIHIIGLTLALGVGVRVQYMDRGHSSQVNSHNFPEDSQPRIHLLYRPGHYDILYP